MLFSPTGERRPDVRTCDRLLRLSVRSARTRHLTLPWPRHGRFLLQPRSASTAGAPMTLSHLITQSSRRPYIPGNIWLRKPQPSILGCRSGHAPWRH